MTYKTGLQQPHSPLAFKIGWKEKWKAPEFSNLLVLYFLPLINNSVNTWIQPLWWSAWSRVPSPPHQHPHRLGADFVAPLPLLHPSHRHRSSRPAPRTGRQLTSTRGQADLSFRCCTAETDVIYIPAIADSTVTQRRPFHVPCPSKAAPELCVLNPIHRVASLTHVPFPATALRLSRLPFFQKMCFHTCVPLYRHTSSHVKAENANRCAEDKKAEKNRSPKIGPAV